MREKSLLLIMSLLLVLGLVACGGGEVEEPEEVEEVEEAGETVFKTIDDIKADGKLVMGTNADYPPFEFHTIVDGEDLIAGLDIEIAKYLAEKLGVELEIKDMKFNNLLGGITTGMIDISIAGMNPSPEREEEVGFSDIYYEVDVSVLVNKETGKTYESEGDLVGETIGVQMGTTQEDIAEGIDDTDVKSFKTNSDTVMNLKTNKIDCALLETVVAENFAKTNEDVEVIETFTIKTESGGSAIATQKGNEEMIDFLNETIEEMKEKGLIDKWMVEADELSKAAL